MDTWEIAELVGFVLLTSGLVILLEMGLRRVAKQRPQPPLRRVVAVAEADAAVRRGNGAAPTGR